VPTDIWKAIYDPAAGTAGAYICTNTASPQCSAISVARLAEITGIDPFPALSIRAKQVAMQLPDQTAALILVLQNINATDGRRTSWIKSFANLEPPHE
jgi:hypothetical protein